MKDTDQLQNDRLLRALRRAPVDATPVWLMRQAGRYLPEYRELRERAGSFMGLCTNPEWACEVTLQPLRRFDLDAAILFSDILTIPDAMGLGLHFRAGEGPAFEHPVRDARAIRDLPVPDPETELRYVMDAVRLIRRELNGKVPLIGFAGSPWTLATYMVEGHSSRDFARAKQLLYEEPEQASLLLERLTDSVIAYLGAQVAAGAQALMVFDTWGGILNPGHFREFSLSCLARIARETRRGADGDRVPLILFTKGGGAHLEELADTGAEGLGIDWTLDIGEARMRVGDKVALQGNLDPVVLHAAPDTIRRQAGAVLDSFGAGPGHVFNLGHGVTPDVKPARVAALVDAVHELSAPRHADTK